jgi:hypothetical protein
MRPTLLLMLIGAVANDAAAQTGALGGRVLDASANPLAGVTVVYNRIPDAQTDALGRRVLVPPYVSSKVVSDGQGTFQIGGLPAGEYHLCSLSATPGQVSSCKYEPRALVVTVGQGAQVSGVELVVALGTWSTSG